MRRGIATNWERGAYNGGHGEGHTKWERGYSRVEGKHKQPKK